MSTLIIIICVAIVVTAVLVWHKLGDPVERTTSHLSDEALAERALRKQRAALLNKAYLLAREELGEEPSVEQILLTRDQLKTQEALEEYDGTT